MSTAEPGTHDDRRLDAAAISVEPAGKKINFKRNKKGKRKSAAADGDVDLYNDAKIVSSSITHAKASGVGGRFRLPRTYITAVFEGMGPKPKLVVEVSEVQHPKHSTLIDKLKSKIDSGEIKTKGAARLCLEELKTKMR